MRLAAIAAALAPLASVAATATIPYSVAPSDGRPASGDAVSSRTANQFFTAINGIAERYAFPRGYDIYPAWSSPMAESVHLWGCHGALDNERETYFSPFTTAQSDAFLAGAKLYPLAMRDAFTNLCSAVYEPADGECGDTKILGLSMSDYGLGLAWPPSGTNANAMIRDISATDEATTNRSAIGEVVKYAYEAVFGTNLVMGATWEGVAKPSAPTLSSDISTMRDSWWSSFVDAYAGIRYCWLLDYPYDGGYRIVTAHKRRSSTVLYTVTSETVYDGSYPSAVKWTFTPGSVQNSVSQTNSTNCAWIAYASASVRCTFDNELSINADYTAWSGGEILASHDVEGEGGFVAHWEAKGMLAIPTAVTGSGSSPVIAGIIAEWPSFTYSFVTQTYATAAGGSFPNQFSLPIDGNSGAGKLDLYALVSKGVSYWQSTGSWSESGKIQPVSTNFVASLPALSCDHDNPFSFWCSSGNLAQTVEGWNGHNAVVAAAAAAAPYGVDEIALEPVTWTAEFPVVAAAKVGWYVTNTNAQGEAETEFAGWSNAETWPPTMVDAPLLPGQQTKTHAVPMNKSEYITDGTKTLHLRKAIFGRVDFPAWVRP